MVEPRLEPGREPGREPTSRGLGPILVVLGLLISLGPASIDLYLPALPSIGDELRATPAAVQLTLTSVLVGMAIGHLVAGPLSDAIGRRRPLLLSAGGYAAASGMCSVAADVGTLIAARALQGVAAAAVAVIATAIARDLFDGPALARQLSRLLTLPLLAPVVAPSIGGTLLRWTSWRALFVVMSVLGGLLLIATTISVPETLGTERRRSTRSATSTSPLGAVLRDPVFVGMAVVAGSAMAALIAYVAGSPFAFQREHGLTGQQFGLVFGVGGLGLIGASQANVWLLRRHPPVRILLGALLAGAIGSASLVSVAGTGRGGLLAVLGPCWVMVASVGLVLPNAPAIALSRHGDAAGTAAAVLGAIQFGIASSAAPLVGVLGGGTVAMGVTGATALVVASGATLATRDAATQARTGSAAWSRNP